MLYNGHMQFQVPQFIETEDKVVGPLTIRQFIYIAVAAGVCAILYFMLAVWLWVILSIIIMGLAAALAFVKIDGRPFVNVFLSAFNFYWKPQIYLWQSEQHQMKKDDFHPGSALEDIATGLALHKSWEGLQTGTKTSDTQFLQKKMAERYQIFQRPTGDRNAARRVDYR
jgi:hypothetical protein